MIFNFSYLEKVDCQLFSKEEGYQHLNQLYQRKTSKSKGLNEVDMSTFLSTK